MNWRNTGDELPIPNKRVVIFYNERCVDIGYFIKEYDDGDVWSHGKEGIGKPFGFPDFTVSHFCYLDEITWTPQNTGGPIDREERLLLHINGEDVGFGWLESESVGQSPYGMGDYIQRKWQLELPTHHNPNITDYCQITIPTN